MDTSEFQKRMTELLPEVAPKAIDIFIAYAEDLEQRGTHPAHKFFDELYVEFSLVKQYYDQSIALDLFNLAVTDNFTLNPFEVRGAANLLKDGVKLENIHKLAINGDCDRSREEWEQTNAAMMVLKYEDKPSVLKAIRDFSGQMQQRQNKSKEHKKSNLDR